MKNLFARLVRQSPAMIVAMLALFVALTGTAVATTSAVITGKQIKNNSITGADVKNKSLTPKDFRGSVRGPRGLRGLTGATGAQGQQGIQGPPGAPNPNAADSDKLDGKDSTEFYAAGSKVADSEQLDGVDGTGYQRHCLPGSITAYAYVDSSALAAPYGNLTTSRYTCANSTNTVRAKKTATGKYTVDFGFNYLLAIVTCPSVATAAITELGAGREIRLDPAQEAAGGPILGGDCVYNVEIYSSAGAAADSDFTIAQYDTSGGGLIIGP